MHPPSNKPIEISLYHRQMFGKKKKKENKSNSVKVFLLDHNFWDKLKKIIEAEMYPVKWLNYG